MSSITFNGCLLRTSALVTTIWAGLLTAANAESTNIKFDIQAKPLGRALQEYAKVSGQQIIFTNDLVAGMKAPALRGSFTSEQALEILLSGARLTIERSPSGALMLRPQKVAQLYPEVQLAAAQTDALPPQRAAAPAPAANAAQQAPALEEIVVTARRTEEDAQKVPIALTAVPQEALERKDVHSVIDLNLSVPGLNICCAASRGTNVWLRGVPGIVAYFADRPTGVPGIETGMSGNALFFDLESTSVLKGPQGTLFGMSTTGGAILLQPHRPSNTLEGYVYGVGGSYGRRTLEGAINFPVFDDKLLVRIGAMTHHRDGYITNLDTNADLNDENYSVARISTIAKITDNLENYSVLNYYDSHNKPLFSTMQFVDPNGSVAAVFGYNNVKALVDQQLALGRFKIAKLSVNPHAWQKQVMFVNTTTWDAFASMTIKNIFGYSSIWGDSIEDQDAMNLPIVDGAEGPQEDPVRATKMWSDEVQAQGKLFDGSLSYTFGTFHSSMILPHRFNLNRTFGFLGGSAAKQSSQTHAVYAQGTYDASAAIEGLSITAGYRYTWDIRRSATFSYTANRVQVARPVSGVGHFSAPSYTLGVQYQLSPAVMLYITNSKASNSGGFNLNAPVASKRLYRPESLNNLEGGVKAQFRAGDVQFRTNLSAFYGWYDDIQVTVTQKVDTPSGSVLTGVVDNAATGYIKGLEGDFAVIPTSWLELSGNFLAMRAKYTKWDTLTPAGTPLDFSGARFLLTPELKYSFNATIHLPIMDPANGDISFVVDYTWEDQRNYDSPSLVFNATNVLPSRTNVDMTLNWRDVLGHQGVTGAVFVSNLTKEIGSSFVYGAYGAFGLGGWGVAPPRMWGVRLRYDF